MPATLDDCFVVMIREKDCTGETPAQIERELVTCATYEEAQWVRRECGGPNRRCIIRYVGPAGGGD